MSLPRKSTDLGVNRFCDRSVQLYPASEKVLLGFDCFSFKSFHRFTTRNRTQPAGVTASGDFSVKKLELRHGLDQLVPAQKALFSIELALFKDAAVAVGPKYIAAARLLIFIAVRPEFAGSTPVHSSS